MTASGPATETPATDGAAAYLPTNDQPAPTPAEGRRRLEYIDTLRGAAALWVLFFHFQNAYRDGNIATTNPVVGAIVGFFWFGQLAVNLFLVVSGFCLYYPLARKAREAGNADAPLVVPYWPFLWRRARRILPPYWALLSLQTFLALGAWHFGASWPYFLRLTGFKSGEFDPLDIAAHFLMIHNLFGRYVGSMSVHFWSIALEWQMYLIFPLLITFRNRWGIALMAGAAVTVSCGWQWGYFALHPNFTLSDPNAWGYGARDLWSVPGRVAEFALGMGAAHLVAARDVRYGRAACLIFAALLPLGIQAYIRYGIGGFGPLINPLWGLIFAALIVALDYLTRLRPRLLTLFRPLTTVGLFSYSVYLLHAPIMTAFGEYLMSPAQKATSMTYRLGWTALVALPLILAYAYLWYWLLERPALESGRKFSSASRSGDTGT